MSNKEKRNKKNNYLQINTFILKMNLKMNSSINGLPINCPEKVEKFFFKFLKLLIEKL